MTAKHEELQASAKTQAVSLQTLEQDLAVKNADAQQLQTQLEGSQSELQSTQHELQQRIDAHSMLESQCNAQTAEIESVLEQVDALKADKQQLHRQMETAALDKQQLQSNLESHQAEAAEQLSKAKDQAQQLQVTHTVITISWQLLLKTLLQAAPACAITSAFALSNTCTSLHEKSQTVIQHQLFA